MGNKEIPVQRKNKIRERRSRAEDLKQYFFAISELTSREIKRKYARSYLGIVWSVLNPLLLMIVISLIFSALFRRSIENYPIYYLTGQTLWSFFSNATNTSMNALVDNKTLLIKGTLPKYAFVISRVITAFVNLGYSMIAYVIMCIVFQVEPSIYMLLFPVDVLLLLLFSTGIGFILAILYVFFADIKHLYSVLLTLWLYMSAIFYPVDNLPGIMKKIVQNNPVYLAIYVARESVMYGNEPELIPWLKLAIWSFGMLGIGIIVFKKYQNNVMQKI